MAKLLYSASMSLDGFIAGVGGDMSWLSAFCGPNPLIDELVGNVGAILAGADTYRGDKYVNVLGADVARQRLEAGVLDEVLTVIMPVLLGDGVPDATNLWYRVVR